MGRELTKAAAAVLNPRLIWGGVMDGWMDELVSQGLSDQRNSSLGALAFFF